ncbi:hypothetical protein PWT90_01615 [Aphanocladium album]|nr:hypothetical protein PWT90_01615 [Aphanocladium album]
MGSPGSSSGSSELKRSCEECSSSKVKCSQDKPVCKRCRKQSIACTYAPPKRTGRPRKIPKDSEQSQPRTVRPLASAASKHYNFDQSSSESDSPQSGYSIDQDTDFYYQCGFGKGQDFDVETAGDTTDHAGVAHLDAECHFLRHDWPANAQDLEALWGAPLDQQPYMDSGLGGANGELGSYDFATDDCSFTQDTWKRQQKLFRPSGLESDYMYLDFEGRDVASGHFSADGEQVNLGAW